MIVQKCLDAVDLNNPSQEDAEQLERSQLEHVVLMRLLPLQVPPLPLVHLVSIHICLHILLQNRLQLSRRQGEMTVLNMLRGVQGLFRLLHTH